MRLIDADVLKEFVERRYDITWEDDYEGGIKDACTDILYEMEKMPTIEIPEQKHGKWEEHIFQDGFWANYCSECNAYLPYGLEWKPNFCPMCGAKMDK